MEELQMSVCSIPENYLISVGANYEHVLIKVVPEYIQANPELFKKKMTQHRQTSVKKEKDRGLKYNHYEFNRFWEQRYEYFERFD
jgi:hypothetical protein